MNILPLYDAIKKFGQDTISRDWILEVRGPDQLEWVEINQLLTRLSGGSPPPEITDFRFQNPKRGLIESAVVVPQSRTPDGKPSRPWLQYAITETPGAIMVPFFRIRRGTAGLGNVQICLTGTERPLYGAWESGDTDYSLEAPRGWVDNSKWGPLVRVTQETLLVVSALWRIGFAVPNTAFYTTHSYEMARGIPVYAVAVNGITANLAVEPTFANRDPNGLLREMLEVQGLSATKSEESRGFRVLSLQAILFENEATKIDCALTKSALLDFYRFYATQGVRQPPDHIVATAKDGQLFSDAMEERESGNLVTDARVGSRLTVVNYGSQHLLHIKSDMIETGGIELGGDALSVEFDSVGEHTFSFPDLSPSTITVTVV